jgi:hypothetical protein
MQNRKCKTQNEMHSVVLKGPSSFSGHWSLGFGHSLISLVGPKQIEQRRGSLFARDGLHVNLRMNDELIA